jgi:hypothetical protein
MGDMRQNLARSTSVPALAELAPNHTPSIPRYRTWPAGAVFPILIAASLKSLGHGLLLGFDLTLAAAAALFGVGIKHALHSQRLNFRALAPVGFFFAVCFISMTAQDASPYLDLKSRDMFLVAVPAIYSLLALLRSPRDVFGYLRVWLFVGLLVALAVLILPDDPTNYGRESLGGDTLGAAYMVGSSLVLSLFALTDKWVSRTVGLFTLGVSAVTLITLGSRGPILGVALGVLWWMVSTRQRRSVGRTSKVSAGFAWSSRLVLPGR